jgi:hypothetical protein
VTVIRFHPGVSASFLAPSDTLLIVTVPAGAQSGRITAINSVGTDSSAQVFRVIAPVATPIISSFLPTSGIAGTPVVIRGTHLTSVRQVLFNGGRSAQFTVTSDSVILTQVPDSAISGSITVAYAGGNIRSAGVFTVLPLGLQDKLNDGAFTIFPNPAENLVNIHKINAQKEQVKLTLVDFRGAVIRTWDMAGGTTDVTLSLQGVAPGIYILRSDARCACTGYKPNIATLIVK